MMADMRGGKTVDKRVAKMAEQLAASRVASTEVPMVASKVWQ